MPDGGRHVLAEAIEKYKAELPRLLREHRGKWVAIHDGEILGEEFETRKAALWAGYAKYPPGSGAAVLVRQICREQEPLTARSVWISPPDDPD